MEEMTATLVSQQRELEALRTVAREQEARRQAPLEQNPFESYSGKSRDEGRKSLPKEAPAAREAPHDIFSYEKHCSNPIREALAMVAIANSENNAKEAEGAFAKGAEGVLAIQDVGDPAGEAQGYLVKKETGVVLAKQAGGLLAKETQEVIAEEAGDVVAKQAGGVIAKDVEGVIANEAGDTPKQAGGVFARQAERGLAKEAKEVLAKKAGDVIAKQVDGALAEELEGILAKEAEVANLAEITLAQETRGVITKEADIRVLSKEADGFLAEEAGVIPTKEAGGVIAEETTVRTVLTNKAEEITVKEAEGSSATRERQGDGRPRQESVWEARAAVLEAERTRLRYEGEGWEKEVESLKVERKAMARRLRELLQEAGEKVRCCFCGLYMVSFTRSRVESCETIGLSGLEMRHDTRT